MSETHFNPSIVFQCLNAPVPLLYQPSKSPTVKVKCKAAGESETLKKKLQAHLEIFSKSGFSWFKIDLKQIA